MPRTSSSRKARKLEILGNPGRKVKLEKDWNFEKLKFFFSF